MGTVTYVGNVDNKERQMRRALIVVCAVALIVVPSAAAWTWPVKGPVLQKFTMGADPYAAGQHRGIDIGAPAGATVSSPVSGKVSLPEPCRLAANA